jgi:hypothetical protein
MFETVRLDHAQGLDCRVDPRLLPPHKLRQFGDIRRDPARFSWRLFARAPHGK